MYLGIDLGTSGLKLLLLDSQHRVHASVDAPLTLQRASAFGWVTQLTDSADEADLAHRVDGLDLAQRARAPIFLPYLSGERTPHNNPQASGVFIGLRAEHTAADLGYAVMEGVSFGLMDGLRAMGHSAPSATPPALVGGGARSDAWAVRCTGPRARMPLPRWAPPAWRGWPMAARKRKFASRWRWRRALRPTRRSASCWRSVIRVTARSIRRCKTCSETTPNQAGLERPQKKPPPLQGAGNRQGRNQLLFMNWSGTTSGADLAAIVFRDHDGGRSRAFARAVTRIAGPLAGVLGWVGNVRHLGAFTGMLDVDEHRLAIRRFA